MAGRRTVVRYIGTKLATAANATITIAPIQLPRDRAFVKADVLLVGSNGALGLASGASTVFLLGAAGGTAVGTGNVAAPAVGVYQGFGSFAVTDTTGGILGRVTAITPVGAVSAAAASTPTLADTLDGITCLIDKIGFAFVRDANAGTPDFTFVIDIVTEDIDLYPSPGNQPQALTTS